MRRFPEEIAADMAKARRLEWLTLAWMSSVVVAMYLVMGSSQAMKTAFYEDILSLIPAVTWLIASHFEQRRPTGNYPYGFTGVNSLAFLASAVVLTVLGAWLLYGGARSLIRGEHPTIGPITLFGQTFWLGWLMVAVLAYSVVVPMIFGHLKAPVAKRLHDKVLHTDALMQKADWSTGMAAILGVIGIGLGLWWADALAATLISLSILYDGLRNIRGAAAELLDGVPREVDGPDIAPDAARLKARLEHRWPHAHVRLRESGRYILANVGKVDPPGELPELHGWMGEDPGWRLAQLSFTPPGCARSDDSDE